VVLDSILKPTSPASSILKIANAFSSDYVTEFAVFSSPSDYGIRPSGTGTSLRTVGAVEM
jgi:hypothetical protein